ncbi:MAG TPA: FtsW/RodA/SpoVE family cell cycle protein [Actinomycetota bacterium]|nr:FtsW/RodA/SpoVE family cell cycle protein [Actinomycetota bacterium]
MATLTAERILPTARRFDVWLLACAVSLSLVGVAMVYSTTWGRLVADGDPGGYFAVRQALFVVLGGLAAWVFYRLDRPTLMAMTAIGYAGSVLGLLAVLSPLGTTVNGTRAWLTLPGGFTLQPAEFAKVFVILLAAIWLSDRDGARGLDDPPEPRAVLGVLLATVVVAGLLLLQPDLGSALVTGAAVLGVLFVAGVRRRFLVLLLLGGAAVSVLAYVAGVLDAYQIARFTAFLNPQADPQGVGYNVQQALIAIGTGGVHGQGLLTGAHTQGAFVPYQYTDFIFSAVGEELGMIGGLVVIGLFVALLRRGLAAAARADWFGALVATGIVCWLAAQGFENLGMNLGLLPVTGVPLPLVSYGGSSVIAAWIGVGLLLKVSRH